MTVPTHISLETFCKERELKIASVRTGLKRQPSNWPVFLKMGSQLRVKVSDVETWEALLLNQSTMTK